jgi:hypothetical protein
MRVVIAYESMYGNTHRVAEAIASGFGNDHVVTVAPINQVNPAEMDADVLVIGAPTHAHGLPRPNTRRAAADGARTKYDKHQLEPAAAEPGVREWLQRLPASLSVQTAAFDTRFRPPAWLVGHPARQVSRKLQRLGACVLARPESFFVDKHEQLKPGELDRARAWGERLSRQAEPRRIRAVPDPRR